MKKFISCALALSILLSCALFCSCASTGYSDTLSCADITNALKREILADSEYTEYSPTEAKYVFDESDIFDSCSIIYSSASDDVGEIGVFHAKTQDQATELLKDAKQHISEEQKDKSEFLRNYLPSEVSKLERADVRQYGNYVIYAILSPEEQNDVFSYIEKMLKK